MTTRIYSFLTSLTLFFFIFICIWLFFYYGLLLLVVGDDSQYLYSLPRTSGSSLRTPSTSAHSKIQSKSLLKRSKPTQQLVQKKEKKKRDFI